MGDAASQVKVAETQGESAAPGSRAERWTYRPGGAQRWVAVAWQSPENNWGDMPGKDLSPRKFTKLTFAVRSDTPGARVEFFTGGTTERGKAYPASYSKTSKTITLTRDWTAYSIELTGKDWRNVVCGFGWSANEDDNPRGCEFHLSNPRFE
jgi:hypothetical protein